MQRAVFTLAGLKIVPTIKKLIVDDFFMIVRCDAVENYMLLGDSHWCKWLDSNMGKLPRNACLYCNPNRCKIQKLDIYNTME